MLGGGVVVEMEMITDVMGGRAAFGQDVESIAELSHAVTEGLPKATLRNTVKHVFTNSSDQMRFIYRVVPEATFKRRKDRLSEAESERTERLARVIATAEYVLGDKDLARQFLVNSHPMLKGKTPIETALSELGARQIEEMLFGIFYGLPA
jgi:putative toxin-antitoxin system antitoxin component (TIGR02293 family)